MPFETTPEDLSMPTLSGCPLCDRQSLLIYPVRYAIACPRGASKAPALTGHFRIDERAPQSVSTAKYTLRALRAGYLYTYDEKRKLLRAYMVIDNGMLWRFPPGIAPPAGDAPERFIEQACPASDTAYESYGRCVDVLHTPGSDEATRLWIGWSNVRWTRELVFKKIESEAWRKQHMQCIDIPAMLAGNACDTGEFQASHRQIAHFAMDDQAMTEAFSFSNQPVKYETLARRSQVAKRIGDAMAESPNKKGFVVAVNDPVGITNDLAELTVPSLHNGFDEQIYWKSISARLLERAEAGIRANARATAGLTYGVSKAIAEANAVNTKIGRPVSADAMGAFHVLRRWIKTGSLEKAVKEETKKASDIPATQEDAANEAWEEASTRVGADGKRVSVIDTEALKRFPQEYQQALDAFRPTWEALVQAHADWLKSLLLAEWMAGNHDVKDLRSGYAYSESCAQAIGAAAGTEACKKVLDDWLNGQASDIRNLYARALMFNHEQLMKAADAHVHASDIPYENFLNIYKLAFDQIKDLSHADNLRDRLVITTANQVVDVLTKAARSSAVGFITIRLAMQAGVRIKRSAASKLAIRDWTLEQVKTLGVKLDGDRTSQRAAATQIGKQVLRTAPATDMNIIAYEMDVDALVKNGKLEAGAIKAIRVPGVDAAKRWLGSSTDFNLGIVTMIFQLATLRFATKEWEGRDQFNHDEAELKLAAAVVSILGTVIETASITIIKAPAHPLSTFIMKQWAGAGEWAGTGIRLGRGLGTLGGLLLAGHDFFENLPAAIDNNDNHLKKLYFASGILGTYISVAPFFNVPLFWPALIASILVAIAIASYKSSAIKTWISHCKFSNIDQYQSLTDELKSFNFLIGG
ncbi:T6SS effector BTH_I2691 family protein [Burkholderia gladioli]|uniref:T6SS effector BTH_I2691 family protein n=2 Tax=Burkholderia gladioli TaxID=28095 RepID=UPI001FC7FF13|nr:T6SS effector BTH_I2691 family protein [Burkholderia gladioli]